MIFSFQFIEFPFSFNKNKSEMGSRLQPPRAKRRVEETLGLETMTPGFSVLIWFQNRDKRVESGLEIRALNDFLDREVQGFASFWDFLYIWAPSSS